MFIDAHSHVDKYDLLGGEVLESALDEINQYSILTISNSMDLPAYNRNLKIGEMSRLVFPTFGVHPWNAPEYVDRLDDLSEPIEQSPMIGEIGLDHHFVKDTSAYPAQRKVFKFFLEAAMDQGKIINLHTKGAEREVLELLDQYVIPRVIVHWYSGPLDIFREMVNRGVYFTVGIELLYSEHMRVIAHEIPSRQLLIETDNPGGPKGFIGGPGTPALIKEIVQRVAEVRKTKLRQLTRSFKLIF